VSTDKRKQPWLGMVLIGVALALLPFLVGKGLGNSWVRMLDFALLYVMLALGLNIVVGFAGLLDLGYIAFYAVGAYLYALLASPHFGLHWPVWADAPARRAGGRAFRCPAGRADAALRGDYLAIVTLGFGEIVRIFMNNLNAPVNITNGPQGISRIDPIHLGGITLAKPLSILGFTIPSLHAYYYPVLALSLLIVFVTIRLENSRIGRAWVAIREDEIAAKACGINTRNIKLLAFTMGASFGGVAGGLFAGFQGFVSPEILQSDGIGDGTLHGGARRHGQHSRRYSWRHSVDHPAGGFAPRRRPGANGGLRQDTARS
jgi:branched-chain amino acid transport system permease protein